jgi:hypothetical protein
MIFANHNLNLDLFGLLLPDQDAAEETNSVSNIKQQTDICIADHGRVPNVVMVSACFLLAVFIMLIPLQLDFVTKGEVIEAQKQLNGL